MKLLIKKIKCCADCEFIVEEHGFGEDVFVGCAGIPVVKEVVAVGGLVKYPEIGCKSFETDPKKTVQPWCPLPDEKEKK